MSEETVKRLRQVIEGTLGRACFHGFHKRCRGVRYKPNAKTFSEADKVPCECFCHQKADDG